MQGHSVFSIYAAFTSSLFQANKRASIHYLPCVNNTTCNIVIFRYVSRMQVIWQPKAMKQLKKIRNKALKLQLFEKGESLANFPNCTGVRPLVNHQYGHRLRIGDWRILFDVIEADINIISIEEVKKRNERTY